jgi:dTDP-4-dehydrorhamnose 3,5-epimerase
MDFMEGTIEGVVVFTLSRHTDARGYLMETFRLDMLPASLHPVMGYLSVTEPGIMRGPHEHSRQTDIFTFTGPGTFRICLWDNRTGSPTYRRKMTIRGGEENPITIVAPPGVVHGYQNVSMNTKGFVLNYPDQLYAGWGRREPVDEIRHEIDGNVFFEDFKKS